MAATLFDYIEKLPLDVIREIGKYHRQLIPPFTNDRLRRAVQEYLAGGDIGQSDSRTEVDFFS